MKGRFLLICLAGFMLVSCAGLRKKDRPRYDMFDNLTSRYNIRYHGRQILSDTERQQRQSHREDFRNVLPVFIELPKDAVASGNMLMDSVIGKGKRIINEKDKGRYIGDAYFILGQANYLKGNYYNAAEFFSYVAANYAKPRYRQAALVWQARALMQLGSLSEAGVVLDSAFAGLDTYKKTRSMAYAASAKQQLLHGDRQKAIIALSQAIRYSRKKADKNRWHFLLGQLMEQEGHREYAISHYGKVARSNADYEMVFHAKLNKTFLQSAVYKDSERQAAALRAMLRDDKNGEYKDQILYYIAETYVQSGHPEEALDYYRRSLAIQSANRHQTTQTHLRLGDYFFEAKDYSHAGLHYDSAGMFIPIDFPDVLNVQKKLGSMDRLITAFRTVGTQDTLLYLAALDSATREARISGIVEERYRAMTEAEAQAEQAARQKNRRTGSGQRNQTMVSPFDQLLPQEQSQAYTDQRFYFNNPDAMGLGMATFRRIWGQLELRDNWRLGEIRDSGTDPALAAPPTDAGADRGTDGAGTASGGGSGRNNVAGTNGSAAPDRETSIANLRQAIEKNLPLDEASLLASHQQIKGALQEIGDIYRFTLHDPEKSIQAYESLLERYPGDPGKPAWYYHLYLLYTALNSEKAGNYRERLFTEFPETAFSHILRDPDYLKGMEADRQELNRIYSEIFGDFSEGRHAQVISQVDALLDKGKIRSEGMQAQLAYLRSLAIGYTDDIAQFEKALQGLVDAYPADSLVTPLSRQHLAFIDENRQEFAGRPRALKEREGTQDALSASETGLIPWPQLVIKNSPVVMSPKPTAIEPVRQTSVREPEQRVQTAERVTAPVSRAARDLSMLPDSATYYFVIHIQNPRVNLAPSRFGIGQFNRGRYPNAGISHQLKAVNNEAQLVYIGPFRTFGEAKQYESQLVPMMSEIMKIPADIYHTFVVTESVFGTLSDFEKIENYRSFYKSQPVH